MTVAAVVDVFCDGCAGYLGTVPADDAPVEPLCGQCQWERQQLEVADAG